LYLLLEKKIDLGFTRLEHEGVYLIIVDFRFYEIVFIYFAAVKM